MYLDRKMLLLQWRIEWHSHVPLHSRSINLLPLGAASVGGNQMPDIWGLVLGDDVGQEPELAMTEGMWMPFLIAPAYSVWVAPFVHAMAVF